MLADVELSGAVSRIIARSERQPSTESLVRTYVETGVMPQLDNANNQVLFGRRGTGKSHVLQVLGFSRERNGQLAAYIDIRLLGSAQQAANADRPFPVRCINLFKDLLVEIYNELLEAATDPDRDVGDDAIETVEAFGDGVTALARGAGTHEVATRALTDESSSAGARAELGTRGVSVAAGARANTREETEVSTRYTEVFETNLFFADLHRQLDAALEALRTDLLVLLDEWTALPQDIQPFLAEFLRKSLLPSRRVTVKIASLEYRSTFNVRLANNNVVGMEMGGDISATLDLDDYYVYDRNPDQVASSLGELLFRHVTNELPDDYLAEHGIRDGDQFVRRLFTEPDTFLELVRASEGVVRDFISIFNTAFFDAKRRGRDNIDVKAVREAARKWYETDKAVNLSEAQHKVLGRIINEVIGTKKARSFMIERSHAGHPMVQSLFDFRVLHLLSRGYSDKENPGIRYNIYTLDYGTYVDLIQTQSQPELGLIEADDADRVVPFDDRRSIRRIVVEPEILGSADEV
jgi:hypothetical protein